MMVSHKWWLVDGSMGGKFLTAAGRNPTSRGMDLDGSGTRRERMDRWLALPQMVEGGRCYAMDYANMGMDQYLLIPFLGGWTSIYQLFWCSPGVHGFDTLPYEASQGQKTQKL